MDRNRWSRWIGIYNEAHVTILDSTEDSYTIQWIFELASKLQHELKKLMVNLDIQDHIKSPLILPTYGQAYLLGHDNPPLRFPVVYVLPVLW